VSYSFQWQRCDERGADCSDIVGATQQDYVLGHADAARTLRARVTASNAKGTADATTDASPLVALLPPVGGRAALSGVPRAGERLEVEGVAFEGTPPFSFTYKWLRCSSGACDEIAGATDAAYVLTDDDVAQTVRAIVTARNAAGASAADAELGGDSAGPVAPSPPRNTAPPAAPTGERKVGRTLVADDGTWSGSRPMTYSYLWQRCAGPTSGCTAIAGATARTYSLGAADLGIVIRVLVSARNGGDPVGPVASARTEAIEVGEGPASQPQSEPQPDPPHVSPHVSPPESVTPPVMPPAVEAQGSADLSRIPGNLVAAATCKVVRTSPKVRRAKLRGAGTVSFSARVPQRVTVADPLVLSLKARRGRVKRVAYRVGSRSLGRSRRAPYRVPVRPSALQPGGTQTLTARVEPAKRGGTRSVTMRLNVAECPSLLTAGIRFSGARAITQLRVFSRTSILGGTLTVPAKLVPAFIAAGKRAGTLTLTSAGGRTQSKPLLASRGGRLLSAGGISVRRSGRRVVFTGIPAGVGIVQVDLLGPRKRALKLLTGRRTLRFAANMTAAGIPRQRLLATIEPMRRARLLSRAPLSRST
jgi:hypothetical protein